MAPAVLLLVRVVRVVISTRIEGRALTAICFIAAINCLRCLSVIPAKRTLPPEKPIPAPTITPLPKAYATAFVEVLVAALATVLPATLPVILQPTYLDSARWPLQLQRFPFLFFSCLDREVCPH